MRGRRRGESEVTDEGIGRRSFPPLVVEANLPASVVTVVPKKKGPWPTSFPFLGFLLGKQRKRPESRGGELEK